MQNQQNQPVNSQSTTNQPNPASGAAQNPNPKPASNPVINNKGAQVAGAKEIVEAVQNAENILVALSKNPDIEELTAAFALTLAIDAAGKNATAIFSGQMPESIEFLSPDKVFETNTNSLQDFIISLNKEKADHLRYKVEGEFVKIYITPYRTMLTEQDLQFTHGDFNVDLVIALDVKSPDDFDAAITGAQKIMHNARVASIVVKTDANNARKFGDIIWQAESGTLTEATTQVIESLNAYGANGEATKREISKEVATALLAGLVAASDRFMNEKTSPQVMNLAARLMSVGADQRAVMENLGEDEDDTELPITPAQQYPATKATLDAVVPAAAPEGISQATAESELAPTRNDGLGEQRPDGAVAGAGAVLPEVPVEQGTSPTITDATAPDGDPNTLPPPSEMAIPHDDFLTPNSSIIEQPQNPVGYVDQLTGTKTVPSAPATPTVAPLVTSAPSVAPAPTPAPAPIVTPAPAPIPVPIKGAIPTVAEIESLIKNRLPLPPEFDPNSPVAAPPIPVPIVPGGLFGQPTAQNVNPSIDALVPSDAAALTAPIAPTPNAFVNNAPAPSPVSPPLSTSGTVAAPANAFKIPSF
jgi:nanoRNase/pAp phosphatase (c-di-AMP/oligoRNAs hydrolase)